MDKPTEITREDIDNVCEQLINEEIREKKCFKCGKKYYLDSYGAPFCECNECWFSRFPKEQVEEFYRTFF